MYHIKNALFTDEKQLRKNPFYKGFSPFFLMCLPNVCVSLFLSLYYLIYLQKLVVIGEKGGEKKQG